MSPCLESSNKGPSGYPRHSVNGKKWVVSRLAWTAAYGKIPAAMNVLHHCDNRRCYNVDHLYLGTNDDNIQDKIERGRHHAAGKEKCVRGHLLGKYTPGSGPRRCVKCSNIRGRKYYAQNREDRAAAWANYYAKNKEVLNAKRVERKRRTGK